MRKVKYMTVDSLFERISKIHARETRASIGCNLDPDPCPNWFWRLEWQDRFTITMIDFFLVEEMSFSPANYNNLTPYAEDNPISTRYREWRPLPPEFGSYYSNHWFLEWISAETGNAYQLHLLTAPRDSDVWIYSKFDLDIYLTWGAEDLDGEDCHFMSPSLTHWRALVDRISKAESGSMGREKEHDAKAPSWNGETFIQTCLSSADLNSGSQP
jgi:hypothetical protein